MPLKVTVEEAALNVPVEEYQSPFTEIVSVVVAFHVPLIFIPPVPTVMFPPGVKAELALT